MPREETAFTEGCFILARCLISSFRLALRVEDKANLLCEIFQQDSIFQCLDGYLLMTSEEL